MLVLALLLALSPAAPATVPKTTKPVRVEVEPDAVPAVPETAAPEAQLPALSGEALSFVGVGLGGLGLVFKLTGTLFAMDAAKEADRREAEPPSEIPDDAVDFNPDFHFRGVLSNIIAVTLLTSSAPLLGSGMGMYGRWVAHSDVAAGRPHDRRGTGLMIGLGCGAVGLGVASLVITSFADESAETHAKASSIREAGYWTAAAGILGGTSLASYGVGYSIARSRLERQLQVRIAPLLSRQLMGVGIAGSF